MAQLGQTFDANEVEPNAPMDLLTPGKYVAEIVNSEMRATKNGEGQYLWLELSIADGPHANRRLFDRLNLVNNNQQAAEIAQRTLSSICRATGQMTVSDSEQLHNRRMLVTVKVKPAQGQYEAANEVKGYEAVSGTLAAQSGPVQTAPAAKSPPWKRNAA